MRISIVNKLNIKYLRWVCTAVTALNRDPPLRKSSGGLFPVLYHSVLPDLEKPPLAMKEGFNVHVHLVPDILTIDPIDFSLFRTGIYKHLQY